MSGAQVGRAAVVALAAGLAVLLWHVHPLLAAVPLVIPGTPALLLFGAGLRREDPYDVLHKYPPHPGTVAMQRADGERVLPPVPPPSPGRVTRRATRSRRY